MENVLLQHSTQKPLDELRFNAQSYPLKDALMLLDSNGYEDQFQQKFDDTTLYLFAERKLRRDDSDAVFHTVPEGYSLNASKASRYKMEIQDISRRGLKKFLIGPDAHIRVAEPGDDGSHFIDMEIILGVQDINRILIPPLYGPLNHLLPINDEIAEQVEREKEELAKVVKRGRLPISYEVNQLIENDHDVAIKRLKRVLKAGVYVSQLTVVSSKVSLVSQQSPRYHQVYPHIIAKRPYKDSAAVDKYLKMSRRATSGSSLVSNS